MFVFEFILVLLLGCGVGGEKIVCERCGLGMWTRTEKFCNFKFAGDMEWIDESDKGVIAQQWTFGSFRFLWIFIWVVSCTRYIQFRKVVWLHKQFLFLQYVFDFINFIYNFSSHKTLLIRTKWRVQIFLEYAKMLRF